MDLMNFQRDSSREKEKKSEMKENSLSTQQNTKDQKGLLPNMICQHWTTQKKKKKVPRSIQSSQIESGKNIKSEKRDYQEAN